MSASMPSLFDEDPQAQRNRSNEPTPNQFLPDLSDSSDSSSPDEVKSGPKKSHPKHGPVPSDKQQSPQPPKQNSPQTPRQHSPREPRQHSPRQQPKQQSPQPQSSSGGGGVPGAAVEVVASHYNAIENAGLEARTKTRIFYMRNFNNWVKSMQIGEYIKQIRAKGVTQVKVLDLGCGKGGDLLKWMRGNVAHVTCADVAAVSIEHCETRYAEMKRKQRGPVFSAEFITADCTKESLKEKFSDKQIKFNLVSCQFAFHYCFESLQQADCMMRNASERLETGGFFIGSIPNAFEIVKRHKEANADKFGNEVYSITMHKASENYPLFGAMYNFHLEDVVECPEFLVHFPTLVKLAEKHDLKLVDKMTFPEFYDKVRTDGRFLLQKINALETYPPSSEQTLLGKDEDYEHAREHLKHNHRAQSLGTLSRPEWEATSLYLTFAFQKTKKQLINLDDYPVAKKKVKK